MSRRRHVAVVAVLAVMVAAQLVACSSEQDAAGPRETTSTTSTTVKGRTATSSTTTTTAPGQWVPDDLLPCAAPTGQSTGYTTVGTWLPTSIPDGLVLESASSLVATSDLGVGSAAYRDFLLAEVAADGRVGRVLYLVRGGMGYYQPGFSKVDEEPSLDRVRGRPGSVARWINRGDPYGQLVAEWEEDGSSWQASGGAASVESGVEALAAALEPLELSGDEVTDPTGRFDMLGTTVGSSWVGGAEVTLSTPDATVFDLPVVRIGIVAPVEGTDGLPSLATGQDATYEVIDGRPASFDQFMAITLTDDGSAATAEISRERAGDLTGRDLVPMLQSLRAVDHDDPALVGLPLVDRSAIHNGRDWATITTDAALGYCRDW